MLCILVSQPGAALGESAVQSEPQIRPLTTYRPPGREHNSRRAPTSATPTHVSAARPATGEAGCAQNHTDPTAPHRERYVARPPPRKALTSTAKIAIPPRNSAFDDPGGVQLSVRTPRHRATQRSAPKTAQYSPTTQGPTRGRPRAECTQALDHIRSLEC